MRQTAGPGVSPDAATLEIIQRTWADILGVPTVAADDDFFELGGSSLIVAAALTTLGERIGRDLPLRSLFEAPTPVEMAELIAELRAEDAAAPADGITPFYPEWVVPLQTKGHGRPVFVFPAGLGGHWTLVRDAQVAGLVGRGHPFYGFQRDRSHPTRNHPGWFTATAADYVTQMRSLQGEGPFLLFAICNGGNLAWEAATQLLALGEEVAGILLYEVAFEQTDTSAPEPRGGPRRARARQTPRYDPRPLPVDLTLLMTEGWRARGRSDGWRQMARRSVETVVMPGDTPGAHNLYIGREALVAQHVRDWIARSEARLSRR